MQLFLTDFIIEDNVVTIVESRVVFQCKNVLRMRAGDVFALQQKAVVDRDGAVRYRVAFLSSTKDLVYAHILDSIPAPTLSSSAVTMCIALPNTTKKLSLIVQKLTEIGVSHIVFWRADRSQLGLQLGSKADKLKVVAIEAVEQSKGWVLPTLSFIDDILSWVTLHPYFRFFVFDTKNGSVGLLNKDLLGVGEPLCGFVGPEGGFSDNDYGLFVHFPFTMLSLGSSILRMETAAIVGSWWLLSCGKNGNCLLNN